MPAAAPAAAGGDGTGEQQQVTVAVRVRPASLNEKRGAYKSMVRVLDSNVVLFDPACGADCIDGRELRRIGQRSARNLQFEYDHVFDEQAGQQAIFEKTTRPLIDYVVQGYSATVFAYGATGSGKTHTMIGSAEAGPGVMVLAIETLFEHMARMGSDHRFELRMSYLEVYNETLRDLLAEGKKATNLALREDKKGVSVCGLSWHEPMDAGQVLEMLEQGNARRAVSETAANSASSRSHAVLQIKLRKSTRAAGTQDTLQLGKLTLVDLAGSERGSVSQNRGTTLREGANINRSLLALGNCINALTSGEAKPHVPYRDSKLTRILKHSLTGTARTVMIATVSPAPTCVEDTQNTLKYAARAKEIKLKATKQTRSVRYHPAKYQQIINELQQEVVHWKAETARWQAACEQGKAENPEDDTPSADDQIAADLFGAIETLYAKRLSSQQQLHQLTHGYEQENADANAPLLHGRADPKQLAEQLEGVLRACDDEEAQLVSRVRRLEHPEKKALLLQEIRCRGLMLDNAVLKLQLKAALSGGGGGGGGGGGVDAVAGLSLPSAQRRALSVGWVFSQESPSRCPPSCEPSPAAAAPWRGYSHADSAPTAASARPPTSVHHDPVLLELPPPTLPPPSLPATPLMSKSAAATTSSTTAAATTTSAVAAAGAASAAASPSAGSAPGSASKCPSLFGRVGSIFRARSATEQMPAPPTANLAADIAVTGGDKAGRRPDPSRRPASASASASGQRARQQAAPYLIRDGSGACAPMKAPASASAAERKEAVPRQHMSRPAVRRPPHPNPEAARTKAPAAIKVNLHACKENAHPRAGHQPIASNARRNVWL